MLNPEVQTGARCPTEESRDMTRPNIGLDFSYLTTSSIGRSPGAADGVEQRTEREPDREEQVSYAHLRAVERSYDEPYVFGRSPNARNPLPFTTRQFARLLVLRSILHEKGLASRMFKGSSIADV